MTRKAQIGESGATMVEFLVLVVVLVPVLMTSVEWGRSVLNRQRVAELSRQIAAVAYKECVSYWRSDHTALGTSDRCLTTTSPPLTPPGLWPREKINALISNSFSLTTVRASVTVFTCSAGSWAVYSSPSPPFPAPAPAAFPYVFGNAAIPGSLEVTLSEIQTEVPDCTGRDDIVAAEIFYNQGRLFLGVTRIFEAAAGVLHASTIF